MLKCFGEAPHFVPTDDPFKISIAHRVQVFFVFFGRWEDKQLKK